MDFEPDLVVLTGDFVTGSSLTPWGKLGGFKPRYLEKLPEGNWNG